jgi:hypothetical protein
MEAAEYMYAALTKWLVKAGANPQAKNARRETAADVSQRVGASPEQTAYLKAKAHCVRSARLQRRGDQEVPGLHAGAVLRAGLSCGALAGAQGRVFAGGWAPRSRVHMRRAASETCISACLESIRIISCF